MAQSVDGANGIRSGRTDRARRRIWEAHVQPKRHQKTSLWICWKPVYSVSMKALGVLLVTMTGMRAHWGRPAIGIVLMSAGVLMQPLCDGAIKLLSDRYPLPQLLWVRFFFPFWI